MNWVLIGVILILGFNAYSGTKKGMIKIVLSLVAMILTIFVTMALTPVVGNFIKNNTSLYTKLETSTYEGIKSNNIFEEALKDTVDTQEISDIDQISLSDERAEGITKQVIKNMTLPQTIKNKIQNKINIEKYIDQGIESLETAMARTISEQIASIIFNIVIFVVMYILVFIIMQVIIKIADIVSMLPILKQINKTGGLVLGLAKGLIVVWVFFMVMTIFCDTEFAHTVFAYVNGNSFLAFLYNNNLILKLIFTII